MSRRTRVLLCLLVLFVGLPAWIIAATVLTSAFERPHIVIEVAIYVALGVIWALPFKWLFKGIGRE